MTISLTDNPLFGIVLTLLVAYGVTLLKRHFRSHLLNFMLLSIFFIIGFLLLFDIEYSKYALGGELILDALGPLTVILAVPMYENHKHLRYYYFPIFAGVFIGSFVSIASIYILSNFLELNTTLMHSFLVKSVTTPIAITASYMVDGVISLGVLSVVFSGVFGAVIASGLFKLLGISNPIAKGVALGVTSHAIGTSRAFELGKLEGAMAALSIVLTGVCTIFWLYLFF